MVNDIAERVLKLMEDYNKIITSDEEQKQFLLQVVSSYRKKVSDKSKKNLIEMSKEKL